MSAVVGNPPLPPDSLAKVATLDQRRFKRFGVKLPCRVKPRAPRKGAAAPELAVETQDVSRGGMFFLTSTDFAVGTAIEVELDLPELIAGKQAKIRCRGVVTRVVPQTEGRVGIGATIDYYRISPTSPQAG